MPLHFRELSQIRAHLTKTSRPHRLNSLLLRLLAGSLAAAEKVLAIYNQMVHSPSTPDHFTFTSALNACALLRAARQGPEVHARALKSGHLADPFVHNSLLAFYSAACDLRSARLVFDGIPDPGVVAWTSIVSALARNGAEEEAIRAFSSMGVEPNEMSLVAVLPACACRRDLRLGKAVHGVRLRWFGCCQNVILDNALLDFYMSCGDLGHAGYLFDEMPVRDVFSWTTVVSGYAGCGRAAMAIVVFREMLRSEEAVPNEATIVSVLRACALLGCLNLGRGLHAYLQKSFGVFNGLVGNALMNVYGKCGDAAMALKVFDEIPYKDLVSWCTIIGGMGVNGLAKQALQLFGQMLCHGFRPDGTAFIASLSACCYAGLVDEALMIFNAMKDVYRVDPQKKHYTCMVDAYGRAGQLGKAVDFARQMPVMPDRHLWGALLKASELGSGMVWESMRVRLVGGEMAAGGGMYALMSNMLANAGRWKDSIEVRGHMRLNKVGKTAGCSWIEVQG